MCLEESRLISQIRRKRQGEAVPVQVYIELTYRCNLNCEHCYLSGAHDSGELSTSEVKDLLVQSREAGTLLVGFTGGEVLTRPDFFEIVEYARGLGLFYVFLTNGTLITPEIADEIKSANPVKVEVSLYGANRRTHDGFTTCPGSFDRTLRALQMLRERSVRTVVKTTVMKQNYRQIEDLQSLADELGAYFSPDPLIAPRTDGSRYPLKFRLSDEQLREFMIMRGWRLSRDGEDETTQSNNAKTDLMCSAGKTRCTISPEGDVYPCAFWRLRAGNICESSFANIWGNDTFQEIRSVTDADLSQCSQCTLRDICVRCPGFAYLENGSFLGPSSEVCRMVRLLAGGGDAS